MPSVIRLVVFHDSEGADPCGCEVERCRRAEPARADQKDPRVEELELALLPHLGTAELLEEPRRLRSNFINGLKEMKVRFP